MTNLASSIQILAKFVGNDIAGMLCSKYLNQNDRMILKIACNPNYTPILTSELANYCARNGYLKLLKWARENGYPWDIWTCTIAAEGGHLHVLKWIRANGGPWGIWSCKRAAEYGHLEVLQWLRANGCPWNEDTCKYASYSNSLNVLNWIKDNGCQCGGEYHK